MQQQVHEECYLVAEQHIGAVEGAAGTCQAVGVYSSTERSNTNRWEKLLITSSKKTTHLKAGNPLKKHNTTGM